MGLSGKKKAGTKDKKILVADDEADILWFLTKKLTRAGYNVHTISDSTYVIPAVREVLPDLILLDILMPGIDGMELKRKLNNNPDTISIPVIFVTAKNMVSDKVEGLSLGIDDYITKPFNSQELLARIDSALKRRQVYEDIFMSDGITGLPNVHFFKKQIRVFFHMAKRYRNIFSLAVIDINDFKMINDAFGHQAGDFVLRKVAEVMRGCLRKADIITRYGGDEFAVILLGTDLMGARLAMDKVSRNIERQKFSYGKSGCQIPVSVSVGIAVYSNKMDSEAQLFELADTNMYKNKRRRKKDS